VRNVKKMVPEYHLPGAVRFKDAVRQGGRRSFKRPDIKADDVALLQYTGGTTGVSKGAVLLHRNVIANVLQSEAWNSPVMSQKFPCGRVSPSATTRAFAKCFLNRSAICFASRSRNSFLNSSNSSESRSTRRASFETANGRIKISAGAVFGPS